MKEVTPPAEWQENIIIKVPKSLKDRVNRLKYLKSAETGRRVSFREIIIEGLEKSLKKFDL